MADKPASLKKMEHGAIGEARAKAFLVDRFWVLERSVDIDGADYLIQRQITESNFLDPQPPRIGIVQVKFIQGAGTSIYIDKSYVCDRAGNPHDEFFVLVLSGKEDDETSFLLSAREITQSCPTKKDDPNLYLISGKRLVTNGEFKITSKTRALDRIEHALANADFGRNRRFIGASYYVELSPDQIEHDFLLPLDNGYADLQKTFFKEKEKLQRTLFDLEEVVEAIQMILRSTDPEVAHDLFEEKLRDYLDSRVHHTSIGVSCTAFTDEDFLTAVKNQKQRLAKLKELKCQEAYFDLLTIIEKEVVRQVADRRAVTETDIVSVTVEYEPKRLGNAIVRVRPASTTPASFPEIVKSVPGEHIILFRPWDWLSYDIRTGKEAPPAGNDSIAEVLKSIPWFFRRPLQAEIDLHLLGKGLVSPFQFRPQPRES